MIPYKSKVMHTEYDILNFSPIIQKINSYPRKENNYGDDSSMFLLDDKQMLLIVEGSESVGHMLPG